jgi:2-oxoisovalerate ferredoxin oxidoreductase beta subunit
VEVLAECPTHLKMTSSESERWVKEQMLPVFPLGVKKDVDREPFTAWPRPSHDPERLLSVIGATGSPAPRFAPAFPRERFGTDVALKLAGAGGDGAQTAAMLIARAAINEGYDATHIPSYGPESRGGTSYADVHVAETEVLSPGAAQPHVLVAFNAPSLAKFGPTVRPGGVIVYDRSVIESTPALAEGVQAVGVPCSEIAGGLGRVVVKNVVALGALQAATRLFPEETYRVALRQALADRSGLLALNEQAFAAGAQAATQAMAGASGAPA